METGHLWCVRLHQMFLLRKICSFIIQFADAVPHGVFDYQMNYPSLEGSLMHTIVSVDLIRNGHTLIAAVSSLIFMRQDMNVIF